MDSQDYFIITSLKCKKCGERKEFAYSNHFIIYYCPKCLPDCEQRKCKRLGTRHYTVECIGNVCYKCCRKTGGDFELIHRRCKNCGQYKKSSTGNKHCMIYCLDCKPKCSYGCPDNSHSFINDDGQPFCVNCNNIYFEELVKDPGYD